MSEQQAGWYPDPLGDTTKLRYWDGAQWTNDYTEAAGVVQSPDLPQQEQPVEPVEPVVPVQSAEQVQPVISVEPAQPIQPTEPVQAFQPAEPVQPIQSVEPVQPVEAQPIPAAVPVASAIPVQPAQPGVQPNQPMQPAAQPYQSSSYAPQTSTYGAPAQVGTKGKALGIAALVLGIIGLICAFVPVINLISIPLVIVGLILGIVSLVMARGGKGSKGFGLAGTITSAIALIVTIIVTIVIAVMAASVYNDPDIQGLVDELESSTQTPTPTPTPETGSSSETISGEVTGRIGQEYSTRWFDFTINSMTTSESFEGYTAASGNTLLIANITITNTFGKTQPFGTYDWLLDDDSLADYISPMNPLSDTMMPESFDLPDGETVTYFVVFEYSSSLANPCLKYIELDENKTAYATFSIPVK